MTPPKNNAHNRCDVALILFPHSDDLGTGLSQTIVAMIPIRASRAGHPSRVTVNLSTPEGRQSGLLTDSVIMTDNLATVTASAIDRTIGILPMADIDTALRHTLSL